jgi:hypothetical protein
VGGLLHPDYLPVKEEAIKMGMTNKQFQGFIRLSLGWIEKAIEKSPDNQELIALKDIFQSMLEDE